MKVKINEDDEVNYFIDIPDDILNKESKKDIVLYLNAKEMFDRLKHLANLFSSKYKNYYNQDIKRWLEDVEWLITKIEKEMGESCV